MPEANWVLSRPLVGNRPLFTLALLFSTWMIAYLVKLNAASNGGDLASVSMDRLIVYEVLGDPFVSLSHIMNWPNALNLRAEQQIEGYR